MKRPWNKQPRRTAAGEPRFIIGFRDHNGVERSRSFTTTRGRDRWVTRYEEAERENRLGEFLEGADLSPRELTIERLLVSWFAHDADVSSVVVNDCVGICPNSSGQTTLS